MLDSQHSSLLYLTSQVHVQLDSSVIKLDK